MKMWQTGALVAVLIGAAGTAYGAYVLFSDPGQQKIGENQQLIPVEYGNVVNQVSTNGSLVFANREALTFGSQGTVGEVLVTEGQQVKKGQPLASLDAATVASLEKAVAQAKVNVRNAEEALAQAKNPHTALEMAQAKAAVANAKLSLKNAQESLDKLLPTSQAIAQAEAAVSSAKLALRNAQESLDSVKSGPGTSDLAKAQSQIDSARVSLSNAENDLKLAQKDWDAKVKASGDALATAKEGYQEVYTKWLGIAIDQVQAGLAPDTLLASWNVDLASIFDPTLRFQDINWGVFAQGPPPDDPSTPWSEPQVYVWLNFYPSYILPTCENGFIPPQGVCIKKQMDDAWDAYQKAQDNLDAMQLQATKALYSAESTVSKAKDSLAAAEEALADLKAGPDLLEVDVKEKQLAVAQANLANVEEALADLKAGPDLLEVDVKEKQLAVAQANLASVEEALANLNGDVDSLEVALKENDVVSVQTTLDAALQRLDGTTLTAPMAGVVSLVNVVPGQAVTAATTVVEVVDPTVLELNGIVNEIDVLSVKVGDQADVTMDALPGQVLYGTVSTIASAAQSQQGVVSYPISIQLQIPQNVQLREGLSATASIIIREENNVLRVPLQALYGTFDQPVVKVMNGGRTEDRSVVLGNNDDYWVAVRQGLAQGDQVVMQSTTATAGQLNIGGALRQFQGQLGQGALQGRDRQSAQPTPTPRGIGQGTGGGTRIPRQTPQPGR